ncbi:MAG: hypothetical protein MOB07_00015 [Acidobacteria bacterium]|nr:hypothetical protein [Acidobacteriota bacterium]
MSLKTNLTESFNGLRGAIGRARLSVVEIVFLSAALFFAGFVAFFYFNKVQPLGSALAEREQKIKDLKAEIVKLKTEGEQLKTQTSNAERILESLRGFESLLKPDASGTTQIINEIESLGKTHQVLTGDSTYGSEKADEPQLDENGNPIPQATIRDKTPKIYPSFAIDTVVIGDYSNLRRFLSDLERSKQFLIINVLTFQGGDEKIARQLAKGGKQIQLSPESIPVSLGIDLDTYFQSPAVAAAAAAATTPAVVKNTR